MISSPVATVFVARFAELRFLHERLADAAQGHGSLTIVSGEAGIGKSRLIAEFRRSLSLARARVAIGRCIEYLQTPYAPWLAIFDTLFEHARGPIRASLDADLDRTAAGRRRAFREATNAFVSVSRDAPLVLIVEDAQWADPGSLDLIDYVARLAVDVRIMLAITHREPTRALREGAHTIALERLARPDLFELVSTAPRVAPLLGDDIDRIVDRSGGNPLRAEQLLRDAVAGEPEGGTADSSTIPSTVQEVVAERLRLLAPDERRVLLLASAIGHRFDAQLVAAASPFAPAFTAGILARGCELQLLTVASSQPLTYEFYHPLVRDVIYREIPAVEATKIHAALAHAWEQLGPAHRMYPAIARQWAAAGELARAGAYDTLAGDDAMARYAYADAQRFYERALCTTQEDASRGARLRERIAAVQWTLGKPAEALHTFDDALAGYRDAGRVADAARVVERIAGLHGCDDDAPAGLRVAQRGLEDVGSLAEPAALAALVVTAAELELALGDAIGAEVLLERAATLAAAAGAAGSAAFHAAWARVHATRGRYAEAREASATALRLARGDDDGDLLIRVLAAAADLHAALGDGATAVATWSEAHGIARARHLGWRIPLCALGCAALLAARGEVGRALEYVESALRSPIASRAVRIRAAEVGIPLAMLVDRDDIVARCDDAEIVEQAFATRDATRIAAVAAAYVPLLLERNAPNDARELLARAAAVLRTGDESPMLYILIARHGALGSLTEVRRILESAARRSSEHVANAFLLLFDAVARRRQRRLRASKERAAAAATRFEHLGLRYWQAVALELAGQERKAVASLRAMGAIREAGRIERNLSKAAAAPASRMTPREEQIAALVRAGMTNRQIAAAFGISEHTVESHLKSIFNRLGIRSRWQIGPADAPPSGELNGRGLRAPDKTAG